MVVLVPFALLPIGSSVLRFTVLMFYLFNSFSMFTVVKSHSSKQTKHNTDYRYS